MQAYRRLLAQFAALQPDFILISLLGILTGAGCSTLPTMGQREPRTGDEIVAAGQFFHTGTPVVLWMDAGGYDAYRVERRFSPFEESDWETSLAENKNLRTPNRYNLRKKVLTPAQIKKVRGGGWDLRLLQSVVNQFVIHFDACGVSRTCFEVLQDERGLSVHFLLDVDGTIYQTLDLKERAARATIANDRSFGIEIANLGAYAVNETNLFDEWYSRETNGTVTLTIPARYAGGGVRTPNFVGHPARPQPVVGNIQGADLVQYDFTPQQYEALTKLTAALCTMFLRIKCEYPVNAAGKFIPGKLPDAELKNYHGILGHFHIQTNKNDPGPAFQWDRVIGGARDILRAAGERRTLLSPRMNDLARISSNP